MTHHARGTKALHLLAAIGLALLPACSGSDDDASGDDIVTSLRVVVTAAVPVRGVQVDLRHSSALTVTDVTVGAALAGASCSDNVSSGRVQVACAANADVGSPFTAVTIEVLHDPDVDPLDAVSSVTCLAVDSVADPVAATCTVS